MSGEVFGFHNWKRERRFCGVWWVETRDAAGHRTMHRTATAKNYVTQDVSHPGVEEPWVRCQRDTEKVSFSLRLWNVLGIVPSVVSLCWAWDGLTQSFLGLCPSKSLLSEIFRKARSVCSRTSFCAWGGSYSLNKWMWIYSVLFQRLACKQRMASWGTGSKIRIFFVLLKISFKAVIFIKM